MTRRQQMLAHIRAAAAKGDMHTATRLYVENRISYAAFREAVAQAQRRCSDGPRSNP